MIYYLYICYEYIFVCVLCVGRCRVCLGKCIYFGITMILIIPPINNSTDITERIEGVMYIEQIEGCCVLLLPTWQGRLYKKRQKFKIQL